ncbi:Ig-like domain repeat protein [Lachnospiraceae bacterium MD1]|uniref:Ig-like domain repeat protein n=1 Tax=Variimorphobacter saccharofermentans TaxID=2755051 RepID=A0A839JWP4_9FIRM|nr:MBG domain-containing protein [Variimorphobacter saccharofermentans]MBB2181870.1 Ig-like domain repeat protein [Variimorphobacter saccharofermentans]
MKMERRTKKNSIAVTKRDRKRVLAIVLAILMVVSAMDFSGMQYVSAADEDTTNVITALAGLPGEIANQQLAVGSLETAINLPNSLSVTNEEYDLAAIQTVTGGAITVSGSAISMNETYSLTGITWEIDASQSSSATFDSTVANTYYTYVPALPLEDEGKAIKLVYGVSLPQIRVQIVGTDEASVIDSAGAVTNYATIEEAITAAMGMSGSTVTLLKNVATENRIEISTGNFSIDLNGNTWTGPATWEVDGHTNYAIEIEGAPTLVMKDTVGGGVFTSTNETKNVILSFSSMANISIEGGTYSGISNAKSVDNLLADGYVYRNSENGELITDLSSNKILNVTVTPAPVKITAQPENFNADEATVSLSLTAESVPADSGKEISYQWYKEDGTAIEGATANVYTLPEDPSARLDSYYCAASCDGYTVNSRIVSSFFYEASITAADDTVTNYDTIEQAITAAMGMGGCTVKLLKDVATDDLLNITDGTFTLDLNGKAWTNTSVGVGSGVLQLVKFEGSSSNTTSLTIIDSAGGGSITTTASGGYSIFGYTNYSLSLEGGSYTGIWVFSNQVGNVLADGYVYKNKESGELVTDMSSEEISNVTVMPKPVTITAQPGDAVAAPGYTEAPTFAVMAETVPADSGETITYQWYKDSVAIDSATNASYTVEPNLGEGTYTYHCTVTCDGYSVNTENATLLVTSATGNYSVTASSGNTVSYPTLETAITAAKSKPNSTVKLLADATTAEQVEVSSGTFTIDLNGKIWTSTTSVNALSLKNGCHVTLMDSDTGGKLTTSTAQQTINVQDADLTIKSGIYENENSNYMSYVLGAYSSGTVTIEGGTIQTSKSLMYLAYLQSVDVVISGGIFSGGNTTFHNCDSVALSGGEYKSIGTANMSIVNSLLASGYGYKNQSDNSWVNNLGRDGYLYNDLANYYLSKPVTIQPVPAKIKTPPQNAASATYGYTEAPTMSVEAEKTTAAPAGSTISYQWYRVKSSSETSDTAVGTDATLNIPTGLDAGTHSFYCAVTCDGYIVNSESATFTVEPKDISDVESTLIIPDGGYTYDGTEKKPPVALALDGHALDLGTDYILDYMDNTDAGTASVTITGQGNFIGTKSEEFTIAKADQSISITEVSGKKYNDADFTLETTGGSGTGAVTFSVPEDNGVLSISKKEDGRFDAAIIGAGEVTITATKAADTNYNEATATQSITIERADTSIAFQSSYTGHYFYTGSSIPNPEEVDLSITGASYSDVDFVWYDSNSNQLDSPPTAMGSYILAVTIPETANTKQSSNTKSVTISSYDGTVTFAYNGSTTNAAWYSADVTITADGYTVSDSVNGTYADTYLLSGEGEVSKTLYFKQNGTGYITDGKAITVNIDKTAPAFSADTDGITISDNNWKGFLNNITFGHFFKENKNVSISATDSGSGGNKYYYYIDTGSTTAKTAEELKSISFTEGSSFSITDENKYIIYAYAVDQAGNKSAYICTDGIVIDKTAPTVTLTAPAGSDLGDVSATAKAQMNETGIITYVIETTEQSGMTAQNILDAADKKTVSVIDGQADTNLDVALSGLIANTTYYMYAVGTDSAQNNGSVVSTSFTTTTTKPIFADNPSITGTYGQQVKDMTVSQVASTNGVAGSWSVSSTDIPSVGTSATYDVVFTPDNAAQYATVTVQVTPTVNPKSLTAAGVIIGEVTGTYTYNKTEIVPTVTVTDSEATITASDYEYSYSNNVSVGTATVTVTAKGNYTGTVSRTFTIEKAAAPSITWPNASSIIYGQKLSASALSVSSTEYGTFAWTDGSTVPTVTNGGYEVTFTPNAGTVANYEAITNTTKMVAITVSKATPAVTVSADISDDAGSRKATLTATVTGTGDGETPTGTVKFVNSTSGSDVDIAGATAVTITGGKATYTWTGLAKQIYKVKAVYNDSANYNTATSTELSFDTNKQNQAALNIGSIGTKTYGDGTFTLSATGGSGDGAVTFESSDPTIVSISGTTATIHKAGSVTITVTKAATDTYNEASASVSLIVGKKELTVKTDNKLNIVKGGAMPALTYTVTGLVGSDTFIDPILSTTATDTNTLGEYDITISGGTLANADNYTINYTSGKLTIINEPASPGGSSGGGSSTATPQPEAGMPAIKDASNQAGWEAIKEQIGQSREGDTVTIEMNGSLVVPGEVLDAIRGTETTLVFDMGDGITWSINGQSITEGSLKDVNLDVSLNTDAIPAGIISQMAGEQDTTTLSLAYDGPFGFTSVLTINLDKINAGKYGNLFYYNPETKQLSLQAVEKIGEKGTVELPFTHASDYVVIISEEPMLEKALDQIEISAVKRTLYVGGTEKKSMTLKLELPQLLKEAVEQDSSILKITYQSSNPKIATVNASGKITAKKAGKTTITTQVTINGVQRKFKTTITVKKAYIKLIKSTNTLKTGSTFTYKAIGYGVKTEDIMFYTSKKSIVVINKTTGKAKARTKGTDYIIVKVGKVIAKIKVKVS